MNAQRTMRLETTLGLLTGGLALVTLVWRDWIEAVLRVDPDRGSGVVEWLAVGVLAITCISCFLLANRERRRLAVTTDSSPPGLPG
jgi:hypothetical protein